MAFASWLRVGRCGDIPGVGYCFGGGLFLSVGCSGVYCCFRCCWCRFGLGLRFSGLCWRLALYPFRWGLLFLLKMKNIEGSPKNRVRQEIDELLKDAAAGLPSKRLEETNVILSGGDRVAP